MLWIHGLSVDKAVAAQADVDEAVSKIASQHMHRRIIVDFSPAVDCNCSAHRETPHLLLMFITDRDTDLVRHDPGVREACRKHGLEIWDNHHHWDKTTLEELGRDAAVRDRATS